MVHTEQMVLAVLPAAFWRTVQAGLFTSGDFTFRLRAGFEAILPRLDTYGVKIFRLLVHLWSLGG